MRRSAAGKSRDFGGLLYILYFALLANIYGFDKERMELSLVCGALETCQCLEPFKCIDNGI